jgi:hypothetical protein
LAQKRPAWCPAMQSQLHVLIVLAPKHGHGKIRDDPPQGENASI